MRFSTIQIGRRDLIGRAVTRTTLHAAEKVRELLLVLAHVELRLALDPPGGSEERPERP